MLRHSIKKLEDLLREKNELFAEVLNLASKLRENIVAGNVQQADDIVRQKRKTLRKISAAEKSLIVNLLEVIAELELKEDVKTLSEVIEKLEPLERSVIEPLYNELKTNIREFDLLNKDNEEFFALRLDYSEAILELMVAEEDPLNNLYGESGGSEADRKKAAGLFSRQA